MFDKKHSGDEYSELLDPLDPSPAERSRSREKARREYLADKNLEAAQRAVAEGGVTQLHKVIVDELKRSYRDMLSGPFVRTAYDGSVEVFAPNGQPLVKVGRDQKVTVTADRQTVEVHVRSEELANVSVSEKQDVWTAHPRTVYQLERGRHSVWPAAGGTFATHGDGSFNIVIGSETSTDVSVRSAASQAEEVYSLKDGRHRVRSAEGAGFTMYDDGRVHTINGSNGSLLMPEGGFTVQSPQHEVVARGDLLFYGGWGLVCSGRNRPVVFGVEDVPHAPYWDSVSGRQQHVLRQPLGESALRAGALVEVLVQKYGERTHSEVVRVGPAIVDHGGDRRFFVDRTDIEPDTDGVMRLGSVIAKFGLTSLERPVDDDPVADDGDINAIVDDSDNMFGDSGEAFGDDDDIFGELDRPIGDSADSGAAFGAADPGDLEPVDIRAAELRRWAKGYPGAEAAVELLHGALGGKLMNSLRVRPDWLRRPWGDVERVALGPSERLVMGFVDDLNNGFLPSCLGNGTDDITESLDQETRTAIGLAIAHAAEVQGDIDGLDYLAQYIADELKMIDETVDLEYASFDDGDEATDPAQGGEL